MNKLKLLDCTLRDGGYYNNWDFDKGFIESYLQAMSQISIDFVELGLRSNKVKGFKGPCAFTTDEFINSLDIPSNLSIGVMVNASDLIDESKTINEILEELFKPSSHSPVDLVRIACHVEEFIHVLPAANWLKEEGYIVGYNIMQIADKEDITISNLSKAASNYPIDILYFADSLGSMLPDDVDRIVKAIRKGWNGEIGIHTHDNLGLALNNSIKALDSGVTWIDSTVTGMGRGPGNAKTEYLVLELDEMKNREVNITLLMNLIEVYFKPLQHACGWGTNAYYYLAGKYGIHPTYIQEMISDTRYDEKDIIAVIEYLKAENSKKYDAHTLEAARNFYSDYSVGSWSPISLIEDREVMIIGAGPSVLKHQEQLERYILTHKPCVIGLNTQQSIREELIDVRAACHPIRILADKNTYNNLPQQIILPQTMLDNKIMSSINRNQILDYGIGIKENEFEFHDEYSIIPNSLVLSYSLAIAASGKARRILLAGFDGYGPGDSRTHEVNNTLDLFRKMSNAPHIVAVTPTEYKVSSSSIYALS
ncbi:aldolase catalytic domain-containing protein [Priestia megaterium]|uniref:aldolase catalytic domain-containing protein n=1 Tax=Priestia megaterium TaxID=1404 RepID=UPI000BF59EFB|nr:aldolase catalytic domain-containing protein [Priestia megaterium]PFQ85541.1 aldolase [Priestia megaterium]